MARPGETIDQIAAIPEIGRLQRVAKNGYGFGIDTSGRTHEAEGALYLEGDQQRSRRNQQQAGGADRRVSDDGGHFIAARFGGPTDSFNHFAQDATFNRGGYRAIEDGWAKDLRAGKHVLVDIVAHYPGTSRRPDELTVEWTINGKKRFRTFANEAGGKHDY